MPACKAQWLASVAADIDGLRKRGKEVLVVTSGAIALGRSLLRLPSGPLKLEESQAAAACGQISLARAWEQALGEHGITAGQILVTLGDTEERRRYLNARATIATLLKLGAVPVINENDTIATTEIRYGDNDRLAARVATMAGADLLILLSDIDGLYTAPPQQRSRCEVCRTCRGDHAADRGHGRVGGHRAFARRHGDQDRGRAHRHGRRHRHGDYHRQAAQPGCGAGSRCTRNAGSRRPAIP